MRISKRQTPLVIKEWYRVIGKHKYRFNATYWSYQNESSFTVYQRIPGMGYVQIHWWDIKDGNLTGVYRRSNHYR